MYKCIRIFLILFAAVAANGCSWLPAMPWSDEDETTQRSTGTFEILSAGLLTNRSGQPELGVEIRNVSGQRFWGQVAFRTPDSGGDCLLIKEVAAAENAFYRCPQSAIYPSDYRLQIEIFADEAQSTMIDRFATSIALNQSDIEVFRTLPRR